MKLFGWFKKKKVEDPEFDAQELIRAMTQSLTPVKPIQPVRSIINPVKVEQKGSALECVTTNFRWFKCSYCKRKVLASKGEVMCSFGSGDYYTPPTKMCKDCIAEIAFGMKISKKDMKQAEKRLILNKLTGDKK